jgi:hypothetical protein
MNGSDKVSSVLVTTYVGSELLIEKNAEVFKDLLLLNEISLLAMNDVSGRSDLGVVIS